MAVSLCSSSRILLTALAVSPLALTACGSALPAGSPSAGSANSPAPSEASASAKSSPSADAAEVPASLILPGYAPGVFPEVPAVSIPDVSLLMDSAPAFAFDVAEQFQDLKGVTVTAAQCSADGALSSGSVNASLYQDGATTVVNDGAGAGTFRDGALEIINNGDGSGSLRDGALSIAVHGDGSGSYSDGAFKVVVDAKGAGELRDGSLAIINNGDGSGSYSDGSLTIINNGDGSGSYSDGAFSIVNDGKGTALIDYGTDSATVKAEPLGTLGPVGKFPSLEALTPNNICGLLVTVESEVLFDFGSYEIRTDAASTLHDVSLALTEIKAPKIEVIGHTDSVDTDEYNQKLSENRAKAVADALRQDGVTAELLASGKGETQPVAPNTQPDGSDNPAGRQLNRRVEIFIPSF